MNYYFWVSGWSKKAKKPIATKENTFYDKAYSSVRLALAQQGLIKELTNIINRERGNR
jgi:hypothetical protein